MLTDNIILKTDSYKASHYRQIPEGTTEMSSYIEARGGGTSTTFFGLQAYLKSIRPITKADIDEGEDFFRDHGEPFNRKGWCDILNDYGGKLPLEVQALPEGLDVPIRVPLVQVRNTDPRFPWLTAYVETAMLRGVWYPTTVATISKRAKRIIYGYLKSTADNADAEIAFKLHDFGARGVSSGESAAIGGAAHLVNFWGTDTVEGVYLAKKVYNEPMAGFSIPAAEHSTITVWGKDNEAAAYANMLEAFPESKLVAVVSDSYDIYNACANLWGEQLRDKVVSLRVGDRTLVIRPDSGDPATVVLKVIQILMEKFGYTTNTKGFKVLPPYLRVIQGDGVNPDSIDQILRVLWLNGISASNVAFGMGGALLQQCNRDTFKFAMKTNEAVIDGKRVDIFKAPTTDSGKSSKRGRQAVVQEAGVLRAIREDVIGGQENLLKPVWRNGKLLVDHTLSDIRKRAAL